jgi:hypothetical protein
MMIITAIFTVLGLLMGFAIVLRKVKLDTAKSIGATSVKFFSFISLGAILGAIGAFLAYGTFLLGKEVVAEMSWKMYPPNKRSLECRIDIKRKAELGREYRTLSAKALRTSNLDDLEAAKQAKRDFSRASDNVYYECGDYGGD